MKVAEREFERILLSSLLKDKDFFSKAFSILKEDYFTDNRKDIFKLIKSHFLDYKICPNVTDIAMRVKDLQNPDFKNLIIEEIKEIKNTEEPKSKDSLCAETLKFVKDALYLQALEVGSEGLMLKSDDLKSKAEKILEERAKVSISTDLGIEFFDMGIIDYYSTQLDGLLTQHVSLNDRLGPGFLSGTLSIIAAPSGVGKSLLMTDLITGFIKGGKNVLLVSLEMSDKEVMKRVHSNTLNIPIGDLMAGKFDKDLFVRKMQEAKSKGYGVFYTKDFPALTLGSLQLESLIETYRNEKGINFDVVFVDYLGIMKSDILRPNVGLYSYIKSISEELRAVFKRQNIVGISASQLQRSTTNNLEADNSNISDSFGTIMTADFLLFLLQTEEMKERGDIVAKITKNRFSGKTETFPMKVDYTYMRFYDADIPRTLEEQTKFMDQFEKDVEDTNEIVKETMKRDLELAMRKDLIEEREAKSLSSILDDL